MSVESKLDQILANQVTIIANQAATLTAIQAIHAGDTTALTDAVAKIEGQVTDIQATIGSEAAAAPAAPAAPATPAASTASGS